MTLYLLGHFAACTADSVGDRAPRHARPGNGVETGQEPDTAADTADESGDPGPLTGIDVSGWNPGIDWEAAAADGVRFVFIKATEGSYYQSDEYADQWAGAAAAGLYRGAYHFGNPSYSGAEEQAAWFVEHGGAWSDDGVTLPGVLDFEWNPYDGDDCYDMTPTELAHWIRDFNREYEARTGRTALLYTSANYWRACVDLDTFGEVPLWVSDWDETEPALPTGWSEWVVWQVSAEAEVAGVGSQVDLNLFNGGEAALADLAK